MTVPAALPVPAGPGSPGPGGDGEPGGDGQPLARRSPGLVARSLFALTKPRIIELLLVTTVPAMLLAQRGLPAPRLLLLTLLGGSFAAGSANTINCYLDRDIDAVMRRTARRPLAARGAAAPVRPAEALAFGILLGAAATALLGLAVNWLAASLADAAILFYVFVYTLGLKRRTPSNIVIGGAAGCFPVLVGWAAVTGTVSLQATVLFAVVFCWTPPHFWALAMKFRRDYEAAHVPMLPVVAPAAAVARKILAYSYAMVAATLALAPYAGWLYAGCAAALGSWFLAAAHRLNRQVALAGPAGPAVCPASAAGEREGAASGAAASSRTGTPGSSGRAAVRLFHLSIAYLTLLSAAIAITALLPWGRW